MRLMEKQLAASTQHGQRCRQRDVSAMLRDADLYEFKENDGKLEKKLGK